MSPYRWFSDPYSAVGGALASVSSTGAPTWLISEFTGTVVATANSGGPSAQATLDSFGAVSDGVMSQPLGFQGQYLDPTLGLYDLRARDYDPSIGAFTAKDPIAVPVGDAYYSSYSYGRHNPMLFHDVTGTEPRVWKDGTVVAVPMVGGLTKAAASQANEAAEAVSTSRVGNSNGGKAPRGFSKRPSALPSVGSCTTAAECEAVACAPATQTSHLDEPAVNFFTDDQLDAMSSMSPAGQTDYARMWAYMAATREEYLAVYPDKEGLIDSSIHSAAINYIDENLAQDNSFDVWTYHYTSHRNNYVDAVRQAPSQALSLSGEAVLKTAETFWYSGRTANALNKTYWTSSDIRSLGSLGNILVDGPDLGTVDDFHFDFDYTGNG